MVHVSPGVVAVIFVSKRAASDPEGYEAAGAAMGEAAARFPGYVGIHSVRGDDGVVITVSYWRDNEAALAWKADAAHAAVRDEGRRSWCDWYELIVAEVVRSYDWKRDN